ncbi:MAG TPA: hypothetical protein PLU20_05490, partial [Ornithinibacter sp.]|nr:hypothetical protein [Ornithinibacter sp.]
MARPAVITQRELWAAGLQSSRERNTSDPSHHFRSHAVIAGHHPNYCVPAELLRGIHTSASV